MKRNILITGTSSGVGYEASLLFSRNGFKVYATMRNLKKSEELKKHIKDENLDIEILQLDVTSQSSINSAINIVIEKEGTIDILLNNAGAGFAKTLEETSEEEINWVTDVNYLGVVRTTKAVLPHMRKQKAGHIINITSVGGLVGQPFNEIYCGAKFAVEGFTESLATYVGTTFNIKFTLVEPGGIATEFMKSAIEKTTVDGQLARGEYLPIFEKYLAGSQKRATESNLAVYQTGKEVAEVILQVVNTETPPLRIRTSAWANEFCELKTKADPTGLMLINEVKKNFL
ncbi:SDR family oxidoreductase [uncultured Dokdonia sp.]|uniref:SDR family oxidoreductase n=1 Tax=uncultured Dokdonia sp. TaxID=575653 RepID=UPI00262CAB75|nr:SDR family oxidoreductase [uncultured Dokdonia sp.]